MTLKDFECIWEYFLILEDDLKLTTRYVEPSQKNVYSIEFAKIIILAGSEIETVFKQLCSQNSDSESKAGDIGKYKKEILRRFPCIPQVAIRIGRTHETYMPFASWANGSLGIWDIYQKVKHQRATMIRCASYENAERILATLYVLILYLAHDLNIQTHILRSRYIKSDYAGNGLAPSTDSPLPDFLDTKYL